MNLELRKANSSDIDILSEMNKQLIEDEGSLNPMDIEELKQRMYGFLEDTYEVMKLTYLLTTKQ